MKRKKQLENKRKALTLLKVLRDTGKINLSAAHRLMYPNQTDTSHYVNAGRDIGTEAVYEQFIKLLRVDKKAVEKLGPGDIVQGLLNDIHKIDLALESPDIEMEMMKKLLDTKSVKQKLLGSYLGIWNAEKQTDSKDSDPDKLFQTRFKLN